MKTMTGRELFEIWVEAGAKWTDWARPVLFAARSGVTSAETAVNFTKTRPLYVDSLQTDAAIIVDLPGYEGVREGLALADLGWRPVPLYNGTSEQPGSMALVDNHTIRRALVFGAGELKKIDLPRGAPPAFLLDSNRSNRRKPDVSVFDNSWDVYEQDFPPAEYFLRNGVTKLIVLGRGIQRDLAKILYGFQRKGMAVFLTNGYEKAKEVSVKKPPRKDRRFFDF